MSNLRQPQVEIIDREGGLTISQGTLEIYQGIRNFISGLKDVFANLDYIFDRERQIKGIVDVDSHQIDLAYDISLRRILVHIDFDILELLLKYLIDQYKAIHLKSINDDSLDYEKVSRFTSERGKKLKSTIDIFEITASSLPGFDYDNCKGFQKLLAALAGLVNESFSTYYERFFSEGSVPVFLFFEHLDYGFCAVIPYKTKSGKVVPYLKYYSPNDISVNNIPECVEAIKTRYKQYLAERNSYLTENGWKDKVDGHIRYREIRKLFNIVEEH